VNAIKRGESVERDSVPFCVLETEACRHMISKFNIIALSDHTMITPDNSFAQLRSADSTLSVQT